MAPRRAAISPTARFRPPTQVQFRIGYAPGERFALKEYLGAHGIPVEDMVEAGLLIAGDDIPVPYDRFRDRVMFPITDVRGRVIAFGGRALEKDVAAKYLNSPETPLFHKGDNLYNLAAARLATHNGSPLVVVEGYVDVIAMVGAGFPASVAPLGTALTENQLALLWKMADEPILCFDGDRAGQKAAWRAADLALPHLAPGKSLRFALLPEGQDPDDLVRSGGRGAIEEVIGAARGLGRRDLVARNRRRYVCHPRAARGAGERGSVNSPTASATKWCGATTARTSASACSGASRRKPAAAVMRGADIAAGLRAITVANQQGVLAPGGPSPRGGGPIRRPAGGVGRQPDHQPRTLSGGQRPACDQPDHARPAQRDVAPGGLILQSLINHPWLLHDHLEEVAALELAHPEAHKLRAGIIAAFANDHHHSPEPSEQSEKMRVDLETGGFSQVLQRVEGAITTAAVWGAQSRRGAGGRSFHLASARLLASPMALLT